MISRCLGLGGYHIQKNTHTLVITKEEDGKTGHEVDSDEERPLLQPVVDTTVLKVLWGSESHHLVRM